LEILEHQAKDRLKTKSCCGKSIRLKTQISKTLFLFFVFEYLACGTIKILAQLI